MDFEDLIHTLSAPGALPGGTTCDRICRTHISVVLLTETEVFKLKKPLDLGFLDFSTQARRLAACETEVRVNRRLARSTYLGVVHLGPDREPAVHMRRLPDHATLLAKLEAGELHAAELDAVARGLARFHEEAERSESIAAFGSLQTIAGNALENFEQTGSQVGDVVHLEVHTKLRQATEQALERLGPVFEARQAAGRVADAHGDLRLEHVYLLPTGMEVLDAIEFNDRFRCSDVASDVAFLTMDLAVRGRRDLATAVRDAWIEATGDEQAREVWAFYSAYRSAVRGKVAGFSLEDSALTEERRAQQRSKAMRHWLFAWSELAPPGKAPWLMGIGGRPGTGKSTLARAVAEKTGAVVVRTDVVRKEMAGLEASDDASSGFGEGLYTAEQRAAVYREVLRQAEAQLFAGKQVIVDASFTADAPRRMLLDAASRWAVPARLVCCQAPSAVVEERLRNRTGDASDAGVEVYRKVHWEVESEPVAQHLVRVSTDRPAAAAAGDVLRSWGPTATTP